MKQLHLAPLLNITTNTFSAFQKNEIDFLLKFDESKKPTTQNFIPYLQ